MAVPMYTRCKSCGADVPFTPDVTKCQKCGGRLNKVLRTERAETSLEEKARPAGGKKKAARRPPPPQAIRGVLHQDEAGFRLETKAWTRRARVMGDVRSTALLGISLPWQVRVLSDSLVEVWPQQCRELERIRTRLRKAAETRRRRPDPAGETRWGAGDLRFCAQAPGTSPLEQMTNLIEQAREINRLALRKNDPIAWATLANGYRVERIRNAIEKAVRAIGPERFSNMFTDRPGNWPEDFVIFIAAEIQALRVQRLKPVTRNPSTYELQDI